MPQTFILAEPMEAREPGGTPAERQDTITLETEWKVGYKYEHAGEIVTVETVGFVPAAPYRPPTWHRPEARPAREAGQIVTVIRGVDGTTPVPHEAGSDFVELGPA